MYSNRQTFRLFLFQAVYALFIAQNIQPVNHSVFKMRYIFNAILIYSNNFVTLYYLQVLMILFV